MTGSRMDRVSDAVLHEVARLLQQEVHDSRLGFATVTGVKMASDLRHARIYVSLLAEGEARQQAMEALHGARGFIRKRLGQGLRLRCTPEIEFVLDTSSEQGAHIERLIHEGLSRQEGGDDGTGSKENR